MFMFENKEYVFFMTLILVVGDQINHNSFMVNLSGLEAQKIRLLMHLRRQGVTCSGTLTAIETVPREIFIPSTFQHQSYEDMALPIGLGQTISQPLVVATMTQSLHLTDRHKVLEIGTGSGGVILSLANHFGPSGRYMGTDICDKAVKAATFNAKTNNLNVDMVQSDLFNDLDDISYKAILFNIPLINRAPENDIEKYMLCDPDGEIMQNFFAQLLQRGIKDQSVFLNISNIGCLAPLKPFTKQIFIRKIERFTNGMVRMIIEIKF